MQRGARAHAIASRSTSIFPASWINANFDVWIGAEEDNKAWEYLLRARQTYDRVCNRRKAHRVSEERKQLAYEELLIAEGSDWNWWYGPEHDSANRPEFDQLFRDHLANVYTLLGLTPPEELSRPDPARGRERSLTRQPTGPVKADSRRRGDVVLRMARRGRVPCGQPLGRDARAALLCPGTALWQ